MLKALKGVKVLDLSRVLAGPYCTMILGDMGAEVTKVEAPGGSDDTRAWGPPYQGTESAYYLCTNRNKRSLTLDLKSDRGKEILTKLIASSDVIIENFKSGTMEKWGFSYEELRKLNPRIIHCSITGFGKTGPYKDLAGYDFIIQAMGGLMSITGSEESGPMKVGVAITDIITGLYAAIGILGALHERTHSHEGQSVDISLFDCSVSALANVASNYLISGEIPKLLGNQHPNIVPYQTFPTSDKRMVIAVGNDRQFKKLMNLLERPELAEDERFSTNPSRLKNREELEEIIATKTKERSSQAWLQLLNENGIPCGPINNLKEVFEEEQIVARKMLQTVIHPSIGEVPLVGSPLNFSRTPIEITQHPPLAGEHSEEILAELGFEQEEIVDLRNQNII